MTTIGRATPGVARTPWAKLEAEEIESLISRFNAGDSQSKLARDYRIGRTTVWRYLKARGLID